MSVESLTQAKWQPDALDKYQLSQGYMLYAAGLSVVNDPEGMYDIHARDVFDPDQAATVLVHAKTIIWAGLSDVIRYSNRPEFRSSLDSAEFLFESAFPFMTSSVKEVIEKEADRLRELNPLLVAAQPLPVADETIYKYIARGRKGKLRLQRAVEPFTVHELYGPDAGQQTFSGVDTRTR